MKAKRQQNAPIPSSYQLDQLLGKNSPYLFDGSFEISPLNYGTQPTTSNSSPPARFRAILPRGWTGGNNRPIGSYVLAVVLRCACYYGSHIGYPEPVVLHADFLGSAAAGSAVIIDLKEKKRGGSYLFLDAEMRLAPDQDGANLVPVANPTAMAQGDNGSSSKERAQDTTTPLVTCHFTLGNLPFVGQGTHMLAPRLARPTLPLPRPELCVEAYEAIQMDGLLNPPRPEAEYGKYTMKNTIRTPCNPDTLYKAVEQAEKRAKANDPTLSALDCSEGPAWVFCSDNRPHDVISACFFADMMPFNLIMQSKLDAVHEKTFWIPSSLSFQVNFFAKPTGTHLIRNMIAGIQTGFGKTGLSDFEVALWQGDRLVCISRQAAHMAATPLEYRDSVIVKL